MHCLYLRFVASARQVTLTFQTFTFIMCLFTNIYLRDVFVQLIELLNHRVFILESGPFES